MTVVTPTKRGSVVARFGAILAWLLALGLLGAPSAFADGGREVRLRDKCEPASFNAVLGPGACVGSGDVTFAAFVAKLNPIDGGHRAWNNSRSMMDIKAGETMRISNTGGEFHTFTEVLNFGTGFVPELNVALPAGTPPAIPANPASIPNSFVPPGISMSMSDLSVGTHRFQCLIHPWMRTVVRVEAD